MASGALEPVKKASPERRSKPAFLRLQRLLLLLIGWSLIAVAFAAQGWWAAMLKGTPQPWWPSLGYSAAIFSVWLMLTEPILALVARIERSSLSLWRRIGLYAIGFPAITGIHVGLFALVYWPLYNDSGRIRSPLAMAGRMLVPNAHTNLVFYAGLVLIAAGAAALERQRARSGGRGGAAQPASPAPQRLRIRSRGLIRDLAFEEIDWIGAAGDYAEVHSTNGNYLIQESLTALAERLPDALFGRIHRQTIIRLTLIREIRSQGRGDGLVRLADGTELRLSRRYRAAVAAWFEQT